MTLDGILQRMPPYQGNGVYVIAGDQTTRDLIKEQRASHKFFAKDYDKAAGVLAGNGVRRICRELFEFSKANLPYGEEDENLQTSRSPGAILTIAKNGGTCDCKHYAAFAAGMLDSLNRNHGYNIDWVYRFASYHLTDKTPVHVFVVVFLGDVEIWIDPAPFNDWVGYIERDYNDRYMVPTYFKDKSVETMSIVRLSGLGRLALQETDYYNGGGGAGVDQYGFDQYETYAFDGGGGGFQVLQPPTMVKEDLPATDLPVLPRPRDFYPIQEPVQDPAPVIVEVIQPMPEYELFPAEDPLPTPTETAIIEEEPAPRPVPRGIELPGGQTPIITTPGTLTPGTRPSIPTPRGTKATSSNSMLIAGAIGAGLLLFFLTRKKRRK